MRKNTCTNQLRSLFMTLTAVLILNLAAFAQTTEFTYQGQLQNASVPANGNFDFEFVLFDAGGSQVGPVVPRNGVAVANGIFSVNLDFGSSFPGGTRFLEIRVRQAGGGAFTTLSPRQPVTSAPYSIKSLSTDNATNATQLGGVPASQYLQTNGNGLGLTNLNASSISTGTLSNARLGQIPTANIVDSAVTAPKIASGQVVKALNGLTDNVTLAAGSNISITPAGNTLTIASTGGGGCPSPCTAAIFNATQQYNIAGTRVLSIAAGDSLFAGYQAGQSNTTGNRNTFVGPQAGLSNTSGQENSFFGSSAGASNTTGNHNAFFGVGAGFDNGGSNNSFFGGSTGANNRFGAENSYFGAEAGRFNETGSRNSFFGYSAGMSSSGMDNSFFGYQAGMDVSGGAGGNSFFGSRAGILNSRNFNSFFGWEAGVGNTTGANNNFFGSRAGFGNSAGSGNTFIGSSAGQRNVVGSDNTILGSFANVGLPNLLNATAIGVDAQVNQSNSIVLGSIAGVNFATASVNVGIGTTAPLARLDIAATGNGAELLRFSTERPWVFQQVRTGPVTGLQLFSTSGQKYFEITSSDGTNVASFLADSTSSKVGIGTTNPVATLDVAGSLKLDILGGGGSVPLCRAFTNFISTCSSSARYKNNVASFSSGLSVIDRLRPVSYNWKEGGASDVGFIAEEVAATEPQLATYNEKGEVEGVKYDRLSVLFVNAFKEQQAQIEAQNEQNTTQRKQIESQQRQIELLTKAICVMNPKADVCSQN